MTTETVQLNKTNSTTSSRLEVVPAKFIDLLLLSSLDIWHLI